MATSSPLRNSPTKCTPLLPEFAILNSVQPTFPPISLTTPPTPAHTTSILVRPGLLSRAGAQLREISTSSKALIVTDSTVAPLYLAHLCHSLDLAGFLPVAHILPAGESHKHLATLLPAYHTFLAANIDRHTPLIALGGGVVGDIAGFLAATLLRGLPFIQIPTTLLAMVDSSIGGKTGVNQSGGDGEGGGKNLIGAFHQPALVLSDPDLLATLPQSEISNGLAECIKHDAIADPAHLTLLPSLLPAILSRDPHALTLLVHHNASIKSAIVAQDPTEQPGGPRAFLNLGHTFAHAFEAVTHHALPHGQAVALGLAAAAHLSTSLSLLPPAHRDQLLRTLFLAHLPTTFPPPHSPTHLPALNNTPAILSAMHRDKKTEHGHLRFILLSPLGSPLLHKSITPDQVAATLQLLNP